MFSLLDFTEQNYSINKHNYTHVGFKLNPQGSHADEYVLRTAVSCSATVSSEVETHARVWKTKNEECCATDTTHVRGVRNIVRRHRAAACSNRPHVEALRLVASPPPTRWHERRKMVSLVANRKLHVRRTHCCVLTSHLNAQPQVRLVDPLGKILII